VAIEAELKASVREPENVRELLASRSAEEVAVYADTYFDTPDRSLTSGGRELRLRVIRVHDDVTTLLTYKGGVVDAESGSKSETETNVADADAVSSILGALGFEVVVAFEKYCSNFRFVHDGRAVLATLVHVPELDGTFIEVETMVDGESEVGAALGTVRTILDGLGIGRADETTDTYTDAVQAARGG
jgi:adenylate cyclase class 2